MHTVDGEKTHRLRYYFHRLVFISCFLLSFSSCQPGDTQVTLALLGDINIGRGVTPSAGSFDFLESYLSSADLALANLESPLANIPPSANEEGVYNLCVLGPKTDLLSSWGLDLLSIANNHRYDCGSDGFYETASLLSNAGLLSIGLDNKPVMLEVNRLNLAFFAFDDISTTLDVDSAAQDIHDASINGAMAIISIHWGAEYQGAPTDRQQTIARRFVEAGAVLIWGHHPHVLQPCEGCNPSLQPGNIVLFSLGNALFDQTGLSDTRQSALVLVSLDADGLISVKIVPFEIDTIHSRIVAPGDLTTENILKRLQVP
jgi:poly-gamma-glutamate synthesis protein (capsule biosynthesis protein)